MRKAILEYRLEQAEKTISQMESEMNRMSEIIDRFMGETGILNRFDIRISALETDAGIVSIKKSKPATK